MRQVHHFKAHLGHTDAARIPCQRLCHERRTLDTTNTAVVYSMSCLLWKYISWRGLKRKSVNWKSKRQIRKFCNIFENGKVLGLCSPWRAVHSLSLPRAILRACCARFAPLPTVPVPAASCKRACPLLHERKRPAFAGRANVRDPVGIFFYISPLFNSFHILVNLLYINDLPQN